MSLNEYLRQINSSDEPCEHYFAASNTYMGFKSYFDSIFSPQNHERIYILKGGPGVGKSTLMKQAAARAVKQGLTPVCYHCSSDPYSLDGVVIKEKKTAILDGTYPHTFDPSAAGVKEIIVNMGTSWNTDRLFEDGGRIISLIKEKSACYSAAYKFLGAEKQVKDCLAEINSECLLDKKLTGDIERKAQRFFKKGGGAGKPSIRICGANSCLGDVRLRTFEKLSKNIYFIKDLRFTGEIYLARLYEAALKSGTETVVSFDTLNPASIDSLYFPSLSLCFTPYDDGFCRELDKRSSDYHIINMRRFCDSSAYSANRAYYRFGEKCRAEMHAQSLEYLAHAGKIHEKIESLYREATDYGKVAEISERVIADVLK